jgi:hypothetical protein
MEASAALATIGLGSTLYAKHKGEPPALYLTLGYFSLMELLQAFTYLYIDECHNVTNHILTYLGALHIVFQPFFVNTMSLYFVPPNVRNRIIIPVFAACFAASIIMLLELYPFQGLGVCKMGETLCGKSICSVSGEWHIAWNIPLNDLWNKMLSLLTQGPLRAEDRWHFHNGLDIYYAISFLLPLLYGSWRITVYHLVMGPFLANMLTNNTNEGAAVWCLLSIGFLLIVVKTPIRKLLHVEHYFLWPKAWFHMPAPEINFFKGIKK